MNSLPRAISLDILNKIESRGAYADILLEEAFKRHPLKDADKGLLTELVYGVLRWKNRIDWIIGIFSSVKPEKMERDILNILRIGAYQLLFLDKIPSSAAVNESVALVETPRRGVSTGAMVRKKNFVNAVLRAVDRGRDRITYPDQAAAPITHISVKYSHPEWLVRRFVEELGVDKAVKLCQANNEPPPLTVRVNTMVISREGLLLRLSESGYNAAFTSFSPAGLILKGGGDVRGIPGFAEGLFTVQDEASQLISFILDPQPGEKVLDACAAPGGKATHIAELMADSGEITALDIRPQGVKRIEDNARRLGLKSVKAMISDAATPLNFRVEEFDRILLDAPCSGTGVLRRHPEGKWQKREEDIAELAKRQKALIENLSNYLKPGGVMVYSVCSVMEEEGEEVVAPFLERHPEFLLESAAPKIGVAGEALICDKGLFKVYSHKNGMDGFFAARLKRRICAEL